MPKNSLKFNILEKKKKKKLYFSWKILGDKKKWT